MKPTFLLGLAITAVVVCGTPVICLPSDVNTADVRVTGTLEPVEIFEVAPAVQGIVRQLGSDPSDPKKTIDYSSKVKKGDVLAQLDTEQSRFRLELFKADLVRAEVLFRQAKAKAVLAERELARVKKRMADKLADEEDLAVAQSALEVARSGIVVEETSIAHTRKAVEHMEWQLQQCTIRSPADGIVLDIRCSVGQAATPGPNVPSLFLITKPFDKMHIWASVPETEIPKVSRGQTAEFTTDAFPNRKFEGRVINIRQNVIAVQGKPMYTAIIECDNSDGKLFPYMTANITIHTGDR
jgi:HlyD family secretion protein